MKKKLWISLPSALLLAVLYMVIFGFSAQDASESGGLSFALSKKCVEFANDFSDRGWSPETVRQKAEHFEPPLRKLAHFSEYACMGVLLFVIWSQWIRRGKRLYLLIGVWLSVSAAADELHQYFVPGRYCSAADVLLDTCGGLTGMLFCVVITKLFIRNKKESGCSGQPRGWIQ